MKCKICGSVQIKGNCQYINGYYYHNYCIEKLAQENNQLKEAIENRGKFIIEQRKEIEDMLIENIEDKAVLGGILNYMDTLNLTIDAQLKIIKSLEEQKKELRSWLENKLASDNYTDGVYYGFKSCLLKLNKLEGDKND